VGFKLDASQPGFVRVDNRFFKRIFGDFAPLARRSRAEQDRRAAGHHGEQRTIARRDNFLPARSIMTGDQKTAPRALFDDLSRACARCPSSCSEAGPPSAGLQQWIEVDRDAPEARKPLCASGASGAAGAASGSIRRPEVGGHLSVRQISFSMGPIPRSSLRLCER